MIDPGKAEALLTLHEGSKLEVYLDTKGLPTAGIGHLLAQGTPVSPAQVELWFYDDLSQADLACEDKIPCFKTLDPVRQLVLVDLCFNVGINGLLKFQKMLAALEEGNFHKAGDEIMDSQIARQRAARLAMMMKSGQYPDDLLK